MPACTKCGSLVPDTAKLCNICGAAMALPVSASDIDGSGAEFIAKRRRKYFQFAALLVVSLAGCVLLAKSGIVRYDSSGPGILDPDFTKETKTKNGSVESVSYLVTYKFEVRGKEYSGKGSLDTEPTSADATVYFAADNPRENALTPGRALVFNLVASGVAFSLPSWPMCCFPRVFV